MHARLLTLLCAGAFAGSLLSTHNAAAQEPADTGEPTAGEPAAGDPATPDTAAPPPADASGATNQAALVADAEQGNSPLEHPGKTYRFVGLRYRGIIVPKFMMNLFGDGGRNVYVNDFGPEFVIRKDGFEYDFAATYAAYHMNPTPFKASSDGENAWEIVTSNLKMIQLTADFLWSTDFSPEFALNYGLGAGFGIVFGDLHRVQAYKDAGGAYQPCIDQGNPGPNSAASPGPTDYCGSDNNHYGGYTEASWANGGSKPIIFPWLALQTGFRFKPTKQFVARLDAGFGTSGFFVGLGADYGL